MNEQFITDGKKFFIEFSSPLVTGYMPVPIPEGKPILYWHGPKIDLVRTWQPALKFMADHFNHEVVLRLFMTRPQTEILIFPLTQYHGTGMSVTEAITKEEREWWAAEGLTEAGSLHSHCTMPAFASGVDSRDEQNRDGLHLTIGKLKNSQYDLHSRMTWTIPGEEREGKLVRASMTTSQPTDLLDWFVFPTHVLEFIRLEPELTDSVVTYCLTKPPDARVQYPESWNTKLIQRATVNWGPATFGPGQQRELSMASDIPGMEAVVNTKKKEESAGGLDASRPGQKRSLSPNALLWDVWSEVMSMINTSSACIAYQVAVSDFAPEFRKILFKQVPPAENVWEEIRKLLQENGVSEQEFFAEFGK